MKIYVETIAESGNYTLLDTEIFEDIILSDKTIYQQEMTAIFKGFTNDFTVNATPNNVKALGYFGNLDLATPASKERNAKIYIDEMLFKSGRITVVNVLEKNSVPSLFQLTFSDGQKNITQLVGDDTLDMLAIGDATGNVYYDNVSIEKGLQAIQSSSSGVRWLVPLNSIERVFTINKTNPNETDNLVYDISKPINSENVLLSSEVRPAIFISDILKRIEDKYDFSVNIPYYDIPSKTNQLTNLATQCLSGIVVSSPIKTKVTKTSWDSDTFREERFDVILRPDLDGFELNYIGYGSGAAHDATFGMLVDLGLTQPNTINSLEIWEMDALGAPLKKLNYSIVSGSETKSATLKVNIGLDVFTPAGQSTPSTAVKPLICVLASVEYGSSWQATSYSFYWHTTDWVKSANFNFQNVRRQYTNLFSLLPKVKVIDFIKSVYTMFGLKLFTDKDGNAKAINDFWYVDKKVKDTISHDPFKPVNEKLSRFADKSNVTKKPNIYYDGYNLKHKTSKFLLNENYLASVGNEYGQLKYPATGNPKSEFLIETIFTAPAMSQVQGDLDLPLNVFYPFTGEPKLNESETRFIYDPVTDELPIFYFNGTANISTPVAYRKNSAALQQITKYHILDRFSYIVKTGVIPNYITCLFGTVYGDLDFQNTLYVQGYKNYIEGTLNGRRLVHEINLNIPSNIITDSFSNEQDVIIGETLFQVMESQISIVNGKTKLILLNY